MNRATPTQNGRYRAPMHRLRRRPVRGQRKFGVATDARLAWRRINVGPWRERVALVAHQAMRDAGNTGPYTGAVAVVLSFVLPRPKSAPKLKVVAATKRPDLDKLARACLDAITGVIVADDSQFVGLIANKRLALHGEEPGCDIYVTEEP